MESTIMLTHRRASSWLALFAAMLVTEVVTATQPSLTIEKTAQTTFQRAWTWSIEKSASGLQVMPTDPDGTTPPGLKILKNSSGTVNYEVLLTASGFVDSAWKVSGVITITNPEPPGGWESVIVDVTDAMSGGIPGAVECPVSFPHTLNPGQTLQCIYSADLPDGTERTNTATVVTPGPYLLGGSATAQVVFAAPSSELDRCVVVSDELFVPPATEPLMAESLGTVCVEDSPKTFGYNRSIVQTATCSVYQVNNVAAFEAPSKATGEDSATIYVDKGFCENGGCTLTQGYWKTHSRYGPAPYDDAWNLIGEDAPFFTSGKTWYQALWTAPAGNPYFVLAHQYIATRLNVANEAATPSSVTAAIANAEIFLAMSPATNWTKSQKIAITQLASTLDEYNKGLIGPGHCSE